MGADRLLVCSLYFYYTRFLLICQVCFSLYHHKHPNVIARSFRTISLVLPPQTRARRSTPPCSASWDGYSGRCISDCRLEIADWRFSTLRRCVVQISTCRVRLDWRLQLPADEDVVLDDDVSRQPLVVFNNLKFPSPITDTVMGGVSDASAAAPAGGARGPGTRA